MAARLDGLAQPRGDRPRASAHFEASPARSHTSSQNAATRARIEHLFDDAQSHELTVVLSGVEDVSAIVHLSLRLTPPFSKSCRARFTAMRRLVIASLLAQRFHRVDARRSQRGEESC